MPLERYAINFLKEVPLPPSGRVDVRYFMPNNVKMTISRPPPNKLPMADFSYRPLFSCLSVENIIVIFQCLCAELTVCICSDNLSLLTPVQEAFLSFLFPLVWQGIVDLWFWLCDILHCTTLHCTTVQCSAVQCSAIFPCLVRDLEWWWCCYV